MSNTSCPDSSDDQGKSKNALGTVISKAESMCAESGVRLTAKRKRILELLLTSPTPLSAYEVADMHNKDTDAAMPTMSVYRILDFLESEQLVHKLKSANKYVACSHITCHHNHDVPQFLICQMCESVKEISLGKAIMEGLEQQVSNAGFELSYAPIELQCICNNCKKAR